MAVIQAGVNSATSLGVAVTPNASAHTKGAWTQIIASTSVDAKCVAVMVYSPTGATGRDALVDIGIGGAGSESVFIGNLIACTGSIRSGVWFKFPVRVPAGTRISARAQANVASTGACNVAVYMIGSTVPVEPNFASVLTIGADTSDTTGVSIDSGAVANTKGSWVQMTASLSAQCDYWLMGFGNKANTDRISNGWLFDVGLWNGSSYDVVIPNIGVTCTGAGDIISNPGAVLFPYTIVAGSDIAVRSQGETTDATDRLLDVVLYGIVGPAGDALETIRLSSSGMVW